MPPLHVSICPVLSVLLNDKEANPGKRKRKTHHHTSQRPVVAAAAEQYSYNNLILYICVCVQCGGVLLLMIIRDSYLS